MEMFSRLFSFLGYSAGVFIGIVIFPAFLALVGWLAGSVMRKASRGRLRRAGSVCAWVGFLFATTLLEWEMVTREIVESLGRSLYGGEEHGTAIWLLVSRSLTAAAAGAVVGLAFRFVRAATRVATVAGILAGIAFGSVTFLLGAVLGSLLAPGLPGPDGALMAFFFAGAIGVATRFRKLQPPGWDRGQELTDRTGDSGPDGGSRLPAGPPRSSLEVP